MPALSFLASCLSSLTISILCLQCDLRAWRVHVCVGAPPVCSVHATKQEDDFFPTEKVSCMDLFNPFSVCSDFLQTGLESVDDVHLWLQLEWFNSVSHPRQMCSSEHVTHSVLS
jgi:hypothetical protein